MYSILFLVRSQKDGVLLEIKILGKVLQGSKMLVRDQKHALQMSIFLSVGHNMMTYLRTTLINVV